MRNKHEEKMRVYDAVHRWIREGLRRELGFDVLVVVYGLDLDATAFDISATIYMSADGIAAERRGSQLSDEAGAERPAST